MYQSHRAIELQAYAIGQGFEMIQCQEYDQYTMIEDVTCRVVDTVQAFVDANECEDVLEAIERARWGEWTWIGGGAAPLVRIGPFDPALD